MIIPLTATGKYPWLNFGSVLNAALRCFAKNGYNTDVGVFFAYFYPEKIAFSLLLKLITFIFVNVEFEAFTATYFFPTWLGEREVVGTSWNKPTTASFRFRNHGTLPSFLLFLFPSDIILADLELSSTRNPFPLRGLEHCPVEGNPGINW